MVAPGRGPDEGAETEGAGCRMDALGNPASAPMTLDVEIERNPRAPWNARRAVEQLGHAIDDSVRPDVLLLVSELITNSVKYGGEGDLRLQIESRGPKH